MATINSTAKQAEPGTLEWLYNYAVNSNRGRESERGSNYSAVAKSMPGQSVQRESSMMNSGRFQPELCRRA